MLSTRLQSLRHERVRLSDQFLWPICVVLRGDG